MCVEGCYCTVYCGRLLMYCILWKVVNVLYIVEGC
jgi:hypothetical protein